MKNQKSIQSFSDKLRNTTSEIEKLVYTEAISLLQNDDISEIDVSYWVDKVLLIYNKKPIALSEKEVKKHREQQKKREFEKIKSDISEILSRYGVVCADFFEVKDIGLDEFKYYKRVVKKAGYVLNDFRKGNFIDFYVSKVKLSDDFMKDIEYTFNIDDENQMDRGTYMNVCLKKSFNNFINENR